MNSPASKLHAGINTDLFIISKSIDKSKIKKSVSTAYDFREGLPPSFITSTEKNRRPSACHLGSSFKAGSPYDKYGNYYADDTVEDNIAEVIEMSSYWRKLRNPEEQEKKRKELNLLVPNSITQKGTPLPATASDSSISKSTDKSKIKKSVSTAYDFRGDYQTNFITSTEKTASPVCHLGSSFTRQAFSYDKYENYYADDTVEDNIAEVIEMSSY